MSSAANRQLPSRTWPPLAGWAHRSARRRLGSWFLSLLVLFAALTSAAHARAAGPLPAPGAYAVDATGSSVTFNVTEYLINTVTGKFGTFAGKVTIGDSLSTSHIDATVDVASLDTGIGMRNGHLLAADYFDAAHFPQMKLTSTMIWGTPDNFGIKGNLTIKGVMKEVVFSARILDTGVVVAETKIDRTDFGMTAGSTIKNEVRLHLKIQMIHAPPPAP
jgi:polyisoprenoid-binding protein YceI